MQTYRTSFINEAGMTFQVTLPSDGAPLWRQPGETAQAWIDNHPDHSQYGPWTIQHTERAS